MTKVIGPSGDSDWIGLSFTERVRTPSNLMALGIQPHLADIYFINTILKS